MESLIAVVGFVTVAMITPGPNNFIVMTLAAQHGAAAAVKGSAGVIIGSLALLVIIWIGAEATFEAVPALQPVLRICGAVYLIWLGINLIWHSFRRDTGGNSTDANKLPRTVIGLLAFQFFNPKSWVLVLTATATLTVDRTGATALIALASILIVVSSVCLAIWALMGIAITERLKVPSFRCWFERIMGGLLIATAMPLLL